MDLKTWLVGCLNSGLEQGAKLSVVILGAFTVGQHLDMATLAISASAGFLLGICRWIYFNSLPGTPVTNNPHPRFLKWLGKK
jgi:hypothetical protein